MTVQMHNFDSQLKMKDHVFFLFFYFEWNAYIQFQICKYLAGIQSGFPIYFPIFLQSETP